MSRVCTRCGVERDDSMFYLDAERRRSEQLGRQYRACCRVCQQDRTAGHRAERQAYSDQIKAERGCADCGLRMPDHPEVFDFDHVRPGKVRSVAAWLTAGTLADMIAEIARCEVVCANCHRIRTRARGAVTFGSTRAAKGQK